MHAFIFCKLYHNKHMRIIWLFENNLILIFRVIYGLIDAMNQEPVAILMVHQRQTVVLGKYE